MIELTPLSAIIMVGIFLVVMGIFAFFIRKELK